MDGDSLAVSETAAAIQAARDSALKAFIDCSDDHASLHLSRAMAYLAKAADEVALAEPSPPPMRIVGIAAPYVTSEWQSTEEICRRARAGGAKGATRDAVYACLRRAQIQGAVERRDVEREIPGKGPRPKRLKAEWRKV